MNEQKPDQPETSRNPEPKKPIYRNWRYLLLLVVTLLVSNYLVLSNKAINRKKLILRIQKMGGEVSYVFPKSPTGRIDIIKSELKRFYRYNLNSNIDDRKVERITINSKSIDNDFLRQLSSFKSLKSLFLCGGQISDLTSLSGLTKLEDLNLSNNKITDVTPLAGLKNLNWLQLDDNQISDVIPLTGLTKLDYLLLSGNQISDLPNFVKLTGLDGLGLNRNQLTDLKPLVALPNLGGLEFMENQVSDLSPLKKMKNLGAVYLNKNQITDLSPLTGLKLGKLNLGGNPDLTEEEINKFKKACPKCRVLFDPKK